MCVAKRSRLTIVSREAKKKHSKEEDTEKQVIFVYVDRLEEDKLTLY